MFKMLRVVAVSLGLVLVAPCVSAQEFGKPDKIVLERKVGNVMASSGGEYQSVERGRQFNVGDNLMVNDASEAIVVYYYLDKDGKVERKCSEKYSGPNTYVIDDNCTPILAVNRGGAGIIAGAALIGAAILQSMDNVPVGPLSTGPNGSIRHF